MEATSTLGMETRGRVRFARVAAASAAVLAVAGLADGQFALVASAAVCAALGLAAAGVARDIYAAAGSLVAAVIAITSPTATLTFAALKADHAAAQQAAEAKVSSAIAEVDQFDAHMRAYQPDLSGVERHVAVYSRATKLLELGRDRLLMARSMNSPDQVALSNQIMTLANQVDLQHNQVAAFKATMDQKLAGLPEKWSHIQSLCETPKVRDSDACARVRADYGPYRGRAAQAMAALERDNAAYAAEKPRQQAIIDGLI